MTHAHVWQPTGVVRPHFEDQRAFRYLESRVVYTWTVDESQWETA